MEYEIKKSLKTIFYLYTFIYVIIISMCIMGIYKTKWYGYTIYIWNLFLAYIPFVCAVLINYILKIKKNKSIIIYILCFLWIIFYPNCIYIVTDYIHLSTSNYPFKIKDTLEFSRNFLIWFNFIIISLSAFMGFLLGFISLYLNQSLIRERFSAFISWIFTIFMLILSSYGIYLGRFIRWNSWDIISNPINLFKNIIYDFSLEAVAFTGIFSIFSICIYLVIYSLINLKYPCNK